MSKLASGSVHTPAARDTIDTLSGMRHALECVCGGCVAQLVSYGCALPTVELEGAPRCVYAL